MKKLLVRLRKLRRMVFLTEKEFNAEYMKKRIEYLVEEINEMPLKERMSFIATVKSKVINNLTKEQAVAKFKYEAIKEILKNEPTE